MNMITGLFPLFTEIRLK